MTTWPGWGLHKLTGSGQAVFRAKPPTFDMPSVLKFSYSYDVPLDGARHCWATCPEYWTRSSGAGRPTAFGKFTRAARCPSPSNGGTPLPTYGPQRANLTGMPRATMATIGSTTFSPILGVPISRPVYSRELPRTTASFRRRSPLRLIYRSQVVPAVERARGRAFGIAPGSPQRLQ